MSDFPGEEYKILLVNGYQGSKDSIKMLEYFLITLFTCHDVYGVSVIIKCVFVWRGGVGG